MTTPTLQVRDLHVSLAGRPVIRGMDVDVSAGEFIGLLGPNGAGKTTFLRSVLGLIPADRGSITLAGHTQPRARRRHLGYVPQRHEFAWDFPIDVFGCVLNGRTGLTRRFSTTDYEAAARALGQVNLMDLAKRPIAELSGGQRQRVLIARALATEPEMLLLDEPFTGLDLPSSESLLGLFDDLADSGVAIIMSTHNIAEALHSCHRLMLFNGQIVADAPPSELHDPQVWMDTFGVSANSPLMRVVGVNS